MPDFYNSGTVSVNNGATTVTGSLVLWSTVQSGDTLELAGQRVTIASVTDTNHLELAAAWAGTTQSGATYNIRYDAPARFAGVTIATSIRRALEKITVLEQARPNYEAQTVGSNTPPGSPVNGDMYVLGVAPTGAWSGHANNLAQWTGSAWLFTAPERGTTVVSAATGVLSVWNGASWLPYVGPSSFIQTLMDDANAAAARATLGGTAFQAVGTLTGAAGSFARFSGTGATDAVMQSIVGTVSQSSGVPTGAIVESGSNGNGSYTKYADGTMICSRRHLRAPGVIAGGAFVSLGAYTFPVAFSAAPVVTTSYDGGWSVYIMSSVQGVTATGIGGAYFTNVGTADRDTTGTNPTFHYIAIGRWF
ncbi:MAG: hypothetical protein K0S00_3976 [Xanthobacteraceae bacterium]|jgi:hypothetical protein|nr:hypothetical protein [Xanthobacteraceae bacterium]